MEMNKESFRQTNCEFDNLNNSLDLSSMASISDNDVLAMVSNMASLIIKSQIIISRAFRRWKLQWITKKGQYIADIYFDHFDHEHQNIYVIGEFTGDAWQKKVKMQYSHLHRWYKTKVIIRNWCQFKFIKEDNHVLSKKYLTVSTRDGMLNNVFLVSENTKFDYYEDFNDVVFEKHTSYQPYSSPKLNNTTKRFTFQNARKTIKSNDSHFLNLNKINKMISKPQSRSSRNLIPKFWAKKWMRHPCEDAYSCKYIPTLHSTRTKIKADMLKAKIVKECKPRLKKQKSVRSMLNNMSSIPEFLCAKSLSFKSKNKNIDKNKNSKILVKNSKNVILEGDADIHKRNLSNITYLNDDFSDLLSR